MGLFSANECQERYQHLDDQGNSNKNTLASGADANAQSSESREGLESPREGIAETPRVSPERPRFLLSESQEVGGRWGGGERMGVSSPRKSSGSSKSSAKQARGAEQSQQETPGSWKGEGVVKGEGVGKGEGAVKREGSFTSNSWLKSQLIHVKQLAEKKERVLFLKTPLYIDFMW
jgi:hypothetical protein